MGDFVVDGDFVAGALVGGSMAIGTLIGAPGLLVRTSMAEILACSIWLLNAIVKTLPRTFTVNVLCVATNLPTAAIKSILVMVVPATETVKTRSLGAF
jgi:hypothetical protein